MNYSENSQANVDHINEDKERRRLMRLKNRESKNINPDSYRDGPQIFMYEHNPSMFHEYTAVCLLD